MVVIAPLPIGLVTGPFAAVVFWMLKPENLAKLNSIADQNGSLVLTAVLVMLLGLMVLVQALSPPVVFQRAIVTLKGSGSRVVGGWVGQGNGSVVIARCTADSKTVDRKLHNNPSTWFSRRARFVVIASNRVANVQITSGAYVFDPGRYRTMLGTLLAVDDKVNGLTMGRLAVVRTYDKAPSATCT